ncbi:hypothetical protein [Microbulbifer halophilus]|uniref:Spore coat protein U domain-containing protein n=1 Tax=Microbulbifer halophilus TaxID=453963 RepID=A0ABW5E921_9GAMM|nr:hypothetical protein [Microbulbifer halophilus]MCW8124983.1 hypothetical protein [Microbulbifer halophilus]
MTTLRTLAAVAATALSLNAAAATNPTAATANESQGDFLITLNLTPFIIVNSFEDMTLEANANADISESQDICVGGFGFDDYSITFESTNGSTGGTGTDAFELLGTAAGDVVPYGVAFANNTTDTTGTDSVDGTMGSTRFSRQATASDCVGGAENARIFVSVDSDDWQDTDDAVFEDTLTVTVSAI